MSKNTKLQKPDVGGTMSIKGRVIFVILLIIFIGSSVYMSFDMISRDTYEFEYTDDYNGTGKSGYIFNGFNGNSSTETLRIEHPMEKVEGEWTETEGNVIAVDDYTVVSDEYVKYIYIGKSVEYIDKQAFVYCKQLRAFYVDEENPNYSSVNGILYTKDMSEIISYPICHCTQVVLDNVAESGKVTDIGTENVESFTINGIYVAGNEDESTINTALREYIKMNYSGDFEYFKEFTQVSELLDNNVYCPYIGTYYLVKEQNDNSYTFERFWTCDESYEIPEGVTKISGYAFYKCDRLVNISIPSTVKEVGNMAFFKCYNLTAVELPDGLEKIGNDAFSYCTALKDAIYIPKSVKSIGHHAFYKCDENIVFYMGAKDSSSIELGGRWQPRSDNSFKADKPLWNKTREEYAAEVLKKYTDSQTTPDTSGEESGFSTASATGEMNKTVILVIIIFFFIPGFLFIALQVIRSVFKDDFLMTKKGKAKLKARKEENEKIHQAYLEEGEEKLLELEENEEEGGSGNE